jgi:hypothetical protein
MDPRLICQLAELVLHSLNGTLDKTGMQALEELLEKDPMAVSYYQEILWVHVGLNSMEGISSLQEVKIPPLDRDFWQAMLQEEQTAPTVRMHREEPQPRLIESVNRPKIEHKTRKGPLVSILMTAAAILLLILFIQFAPPQGIQAGVLGDSLGAKWADCDSAMTPGTPLTIGTENLLLREGYAELVFNTHARVMVEGPAEFQITSADRIRLHYGKVYAIVPPEAVGFTIQTHTATIVDLGTEFGVQADIRGDTSLHVLKGKTVLIAGDHSDKASVEVTEGVAKKVISATQSISDIDCDEHLFVRAIDSDSNFIWRGQTHICLADIAAGGSGFEKVRSLIGLDPGTGQYASTLFKNRRRSENAYTRVPGSTFIDGVFVPDGGEDGRVVITSSHETTPCPDTTGDYTYGIAVYTGNIQNHYEAIPPATFGGRTYENNAILMIHSNAGITFDLQAIRQSLSGLDLTHFRAFGGLSESSISNAPSLPDVDFLVLVDGQVRYERKALTLDNGEISFDIELSPHHRFLTLIVTDGSRPNEAKRKFLAWDNDFFYLVDPTLHLAETSN